MATNNSVDVGLAGSTGTVNFVGSTSPTLVTPILGAATATSVTFSPTTGGIVGTTTNDNAGAGKVGEFISSVITTGAPVTFTSATPKDLTSIVLSAGDWDVFGNIYAQGTTVQQAIVWISATSATQPNAALFNTVTPLATGASCGLPAPYFRASLTTNTTIYISGTEVGTGTINCSGGIYARRVR
jgi:hypothetical protein